MQLKHPEGFRFKVKDHGDGIWTVTNAYEGELCYFKDRPLPKLTSVSEVSDQIHSEKT